MDLFSPEAMGGAGVTMGGVLLVTFIRLAVKVSKFFDHLSDWLKSHKRYMESTAKHYEREESHQGRVEQVLFSIDANIRGAPRPTTGEHTPVGGIPVPQPQHGTQS